MQGLPRSTEHTKSTHTHPIPNKFMRERLTDSFTIQSVGTADQMEESAQRREATGKEWLKTSKSAYSNSSNNINFIPNLCNVLSSVEGE